MHTQNYTKHATIRPVVLSSSAYRHLGSAVFPQGRRTSVTLVTSPEHFAPLFKLGGKQPLFVPTTNPDGLSVTLTSENVNFPCWLTISSADFARLCDKAGVDVDEPFITTLDDHLALMWDPTDYPFPAFEAPTLEDAADLADFANEHLGSYYGKPQPSIISRKLPNGKWQRKGTRHPRTPKRRKPSNGYKQRITRKTPANKRKFDPASYTPAQHQADIALLWGAA